MNMTVDQTDFFKTLTEKSDGGALRGDYALADAQYVVKQDWKAYTPEQHALWRRLYERQARLAPGRACDVFIDSLAKMGAADGIPDLERTSALLFKATGWRLVENDWTPAQRQRITYLSASKYRSEAWNGKR